MLHVLLLNRELDQYFLFYNHFNKLISLTPSPGSVIVDYEVEVAKTASATNKLNKANVDMVSGKENITVLNQTVSADSVAMENVTGMS